MEGDSRRIEEKALDIVDEVVRRTESGEKTDSEMEKLRGSECEKCRRVICEAIPDCFDHVLLRCEFCHCDCHDRGFQENSFETLNNRIEKFNLEEDEEPWRLSELYSGMIRWTERYDPDNQDKIWELLDKKQQCEEKRPESKRKAAKLGKITSRKIRWLTINKSADCPEIFSLHEKNLALSTSSGDRRSQAMALSLMIRWITEHAPERIDECDRLWEMQLTADKLRFFEGSTESDISQRITLALMIRWYCKYKPSEEEKIFKLVRRF